jgi:carbon starvation protein CstA
VGCIQYCCNHSNCIIYGHLHALYPPGKIAEVSIIGFVLMMAAIVYGGDVAKDPYWGPFFTLTGTQLTWALIIYGFIASVLPVWLLLHHVIIYQPSLKLV